MKIKKYLPTIISLAICAIIFAILLVVVGNKRTNPSGDQGSYTCYELAKVESVISEDLKKEELFENNYVGSQDLMITIKTGEFKGMLMTAQNFLGALYGTRVKEGDSLVTTLYVENGNVESITVYEIDRSVPILIILAIFVAVTILIGRKKGLRSLLGLVFTVVTYIGILVPLLMSGAPSIITTLLICLYVAFVSYLFLEGVTRKTICAMLGTSLGLLFAIGFGLLAQSLVKVDGMRIGDYVDALLQLKQGGTPLELKGLLIDGMIVASLGAIMDVAMSIASSIQELVTVNPELTAKDIWKSGMNIGQDMIGTMTNTLILAFIGSSFVLVLYISSLNIPIHELLSSNLVATELVHGIASSVGVIVSVPLTVLISMFAYKKRTAK